MTMRLLPSGGIVCPSQCDADRDSREILVSIVIPMFNERAGLDELFATISTVMQQCEVSYELVCVDDGSTDGTYAALKQRDDLPVRAYRLSRNYGKEVALSAGLDLALGDVVIPMDADLQEPPELLQEMIAQWREGYDVVFAVRASRDFDGPVKSLSARAFYKIFNRISESGIPENVGDFRLMDRAVVDVLKQMPERNRFMKGMLSWPGFRTSSIYFDRPERHVGASKWTAHGLLDLAVNGLTSFSIVPLRIASLLGGIISIFSLLFGVFVVLKRILFGDPVQGYASLMTMTVFLGGIQLFALGVVGEYVGRIYMESKRRPLYVIMESNEQGGKGNNA